MPAAIGSSSSSAVLLELVHAGLAPAGIVLDEPDAILLVGLVVAREMGWQTCPAVRIDAATFSGLTAGDHCIASDGEIRAAF